LAFFFSFGFWVPLQILVAKTFSRKKEKKKEKKRMKFYCFPAHHTNIKNLTDYRWERREQTTEQPKLPYLRNDFPAAPFLCTEGFAAVTSTTGSTTCPKTCNDPVLARCHSASWQCHFLSQARNPWGREDLGGLSKN